MPVWVFVLTVLGAFILAYWMGARDTLPFPVPDPGNFIYGAPSLEARDTMVDVLGRCGLAARGHRVTSFADRVFLRRRIVVSYTPPASHALIGNAGAGISIVDPNPVATAHEATEFLRRKGFRAMVITGSDSWAPKDSIAFVVTDATSNWVLVFRKHILKMGLPSCGGVNEEG